MAMALYWHSGFMITGVVLIAAAICTSVCMRRKSWWLSIHKIFAFSAVSAVLGGVIAAVIMVSIMRGEHLSVCHAYLGTIVVFLSIATPVFGLLQFKIKTHKSSIRLFHKILAALLFILMISNIISGAFLVGII